jgi:hypothetical protein
MGIKMGKINISKEVDISRIVPGDIILHNGKPMTVCKKDIQKGFCGITIFGDSYNSGTKKVERITVYNEK